MNKFLVTYEIDYVHRVTVGTEAEDEQAALAGAQRAFDESSIWDDTATMPLLYDDFDEKEGESLVFSAEPVSTFPDRDGSVLELKRRQFAFEACRALLAGDHESAMQSAAQAVDAVNPLSDCAGGWGLPADSARDLRIAVVLQGGIVQSVVSDQPSLLPNEVLVIDYDVKGTDEDDCCWVPQDYGCDAEAIVYSQPIELPKIGLDAVFEQFSSRRP